MILYIIFTGFFMILLAPVLQKWIGDKRVGLTIGGLFVVVLGFTLNLLVGRLMNPAGILSGLIISWSIIVFVYMKIRFQLMGSNEPMNAIHHCKSELYLGQETRQPTSGTGWGGLDRQGADFTYAGITHGLVYACKCIPTDSSLRNWLWAKGYDYYGVWFWAYKVQIDRTISIVCVQKESGCKIDKPVSIVGPSKGKDRSLRGDIVEDIEYINDGLTIVVTMGVAKEASSIVLSGRAKRSGISGSIKITFPDASISTGTIDMGTYKWRCKPTVSETSSGTDSSSTASDDLESGNSEEVTGWRIDDSNPITGREYYIFTDYDLFVRLVCDHRRDPEIDDPQCWELTGEFVRDEGGEDGTVIKVTSYEEITDDVDCD